MMARALTIGLAVALILVPALVRADDDVRTVTVSGVGAASAVPDMAAFSVTASAQAPDAEAAMREASKDANAVLAVLQSAGIDKNDLRTSTVALHPVYDRGVRGQNTPPKLVGYKASLTTTARVRDVSKLGAVLGAVSRAGASGLGDIRFDVADRKPLQDHARRAAVQDASRAAGVLAAAAGMALGPIVTLVENGGGAPGPRPMMAMRAESADAVPVMAGDITVEVRVQAVYELAAK